MSLGVTAEENCSRMTWDRVIIITHHDHLLSTHHPRLTPPFTHSQLHPENEEVIQLLMDIHAEFFASLFNVYPCSLASSLLPCSAQYHHSSAYAYAYQDHPQPQPQPQDDYIYILVTNHRQQEDRTIHGFLVH